MQPNAKKTKTLVPPVVPSTIDANAVSAVLSSSATMTCREGRIVTLHTRWTPPPRRARGRGGRTTRQSAVGSLPRRTSGPRRRSAAM